MGEHRLPLLLHVMNLHVKLEMVKHAAESISFYINLKFAILLTIPFFSFLFFLFFFFFEDLRLVNHDLRYYDRYVYLSCQSNVFSFY